MTVRAGKMLVDEIIPRLKVAIPKAVPHIGCEDHEELIQDATVTAAGMLIRAHAQGKDVTAGNIAYYAILHTKSGRRSYGSSKVDVMAAGTQLNGRTAVHSMEEELGYQQDEFDGPATLGEMLASQCEDPSMMAARNLDWADFLGQLDKRQLIMLSDVAVGDTPTFTLRKKKLCYESIRQIKRSMADQVVESFGEKALADATRKPAWWGDLNAERELSACRADRRH